MRATSEFPVNGRYREPSGFTPTLMHRTFRDETARGFAA
jgi:hypothetical protein